MKNINSIDEMKKRVEVLSEDNIKNGSKESIVIFRVPKRKKKINNKNENHKNDGIYNTNGLFRDNKQKKDY